MKIVEPQSSVLSNAEVLAHLDHIASRRREQAGPNGVPTLKSANFETVIRELTAYLNPSVPGSSHPNTTGAASHAPAAGSSSTPGPEHPLPQYATQDAEVIGRVVRRLAPFKLTKAEMLMVLNLRPGDAVLLDLVVEECDERLSAEQQEEIVGIVREELGGAVEEEG